MARSTAKAAALALLLLAGLLLVSGAKGPRKGAGAGAGAGAELLHGPTLRGQIKGRFKVNVPIFRDRREPGVIIPETMVVASRTVPDKPL